MEAKFFLLSHFFKKFILRGDACCYVQRPHSIAYSYYLLIMYVLGLIYGDTAQLLSSNGNQKNTFLNNIFFVFIHSEKLF